MTHDELVEKVARALSDRDGMYVEPPVWHRGYARAALAVIADAAGGLQACETVGIAAQIAGRRVEGEPDAFLRVAALLRALVPPGGGDAG